MINIWYNISADRCKQLTKELTKTLTPQIHDSIERELKPKLSKELLKKHEHDIRKQVENEQWDRAMKQARKELEDEKPSNSQSNGFVEFVHETEIDAQAQAVVASAAAKKFRDKAKWSQRLLGPIPWMLLVSAVPLLYTVWMSVPIFVAAFLGFLAAFLVILISNVRRHNLLKQNADHAAEISSKYLILAERARLYRQVHAKRLSTNSRLDNLVQTLQREKENIDDQFFPCVSHLEEVKATVRRQRIEIPALLNDIKDFDDRLAEAEAQVSKCKKQ